MAVAAASGCGTSGEFPAAETGQAESELGSGTGPGTAELARMRRYLDERYDPSAVVHRFRSANGDDIDCLPIEAQPALRGRALATPPPAPSGEAAPADDTGSMFGLDDSLDETGAMRSCPAGTVPIVRLELEHLARFDTLEDFFRKTPPGADARVPNEEEPRLGSTATHQYAVAMKTIDNWGSEATLALYNPYTELNTDFSLSQIWIVRGADADRQTVEAGWQRYPLKYGDAYARLFIYYTPNNYVNGCYNLDCTAFVQTNTSIPIGAKFGNYSTPGGAQYVQLYRWQKSGTTGDWWLAIGSTWVGYYPRSLFDAAGIGDKGGRVDFGGEIVDKVTTRHTMTDMGSGRFPSEGKTYAAYQRNIRYIDLTNTYRVPTSLSKVVTDAYCYDETITTGDASWGTYILFGGPGYSSPNCE